MLILFYEAINKPVDINWAKTRISKMMTSQYQKLRMSLKSLLYIVPFTWNYKIIKNCNRF